MVLVLVGETRFTTSSGFVDTVVEVLVSVEVPVSVELSDSVVVDDEVEVEVLDEVPAALRAISC